MHLNIYFFLVITFACSTTYPMQQQPNPNDYNNSPTTEEEGEGEESEEDEEILDNMADLFDVLVQSGNLQEILIAQPNLTQQRDENGQTLLHHAVALDEPTSVTTVVEAGTDIDAVDNDGNTALHILADIEDTREDAQERQISMARDLINHGAAFNTQNNAGQTPAEIAREHGNEALAQALERPASR